MPKISMMITIELNPTVFLTREVDWPFVPAEGDSVSLVDAAGWEEEVKHRFFGIDGQPALDFGRHGPENYSGDIIADLRATGWS